MEAQQRPPAVATSKDGDRQRRRRIELHTYMEVFAIRLDWEAHVIEKDPDDVKVPVGDVYKRGRKCDGCRLALGLEHRARWCCKVCNVAMCEDCYGLWHKNEYFVRDRKHLHACQ